MKRRILILLLTALLLTAGISAAAAPIPAPAATLQADTGAPETRTLTFAVSAPLLREYETRRAEALATLRKTQTDAQIADSGSAALLYPAGLLCEARANGGEWIPVSFDSVFDETHAISLTGDILPALAEHGAYRSEAFGFSLRFTGAVNDDGYYVAISEPGEAFSFVCPESAYVRYILPPGTDNGGNPVFRFPGFAEPAALADPSLTGHIFEGWQTADGTYVEEIPAGTRTLTLTARFTPRVYRVSYVLTTRPGYVFNRIPNTENPAHYTYGVTEPIKTVDSPRGYSFRGWYETADLSGEPITEIPAGRTGDVILYARWLTEEAAIAEDVAAAGWGDLNGDGAVTAADARIALRAAVGLETLTPERLAKADFARLGKLNAGVARILLRVAVGLETMPDVLRGYGRL